MNETLPQLRLFVDDENSAANAIVVPPTLLEQLRQSFEQATGWPLLHAEENQSIPSAVWRQPIRGPRREQTSTLALAEPPVPGKQIEQRAATQLASQIAQLLDSHYATQTALWKSEAHLASAIPLVVRPEEDDRQLARRLEAVLRCAVEAVGATSAALYILDDDTSYLKLRAEWGLPEECFADPPRRLRGSKGDLEALTGHAVVLEQPERCEAWDIPQPAASAVCVPVSTAEVPLGTLWIFGGEPRTYHDTDINLIEVIAGRLAVELEREILLRERLLGSKNRDAKEVAVWQKNQWDCAIPKLDRWQMAASPSTYDSIHGDVLSSHWTDEQRLGFTMASADRTGTCGALAAAMFASAERSHRGLASPARRLKRIHETIAALSSGDQTLHALSGLVELTTGKIQLSMAGFVDVFAVRPHSWENLGGQVREEAVGTCGESTFGLVKSMLAPGDALMILAGRKRSDSLQPTIPRADGAYLAEALLRHTHLSAQQMVDYLVALATREATVWTDAPAILVWRRLE